MLTDWRKDNAGVRLESSLEEFASEIEELSNGHPGIVGVCCKEFANESINADAAENSYSTLAFQKHAAQALPYRLQQADIFDHLFSDLEPALSVPQSFMLRQVWKPLP